MTAEKLYDAVVNGIPYAHANNLSRRFSLSVCEENNKGNEWADSVTFVGSANDMLKVCKDLSKLGVDSMFGQPTFRTGRLYEVSVCLWADFYLDDSEHAERDAYYTVSRLTPLPYSVPVPSVSASEPEEAEEGYECPEAFCVDDEEIVI